MSLLNAWYLLIPIAAAGAGVLILWLRGKRPTTRDVLRPLPPAALWPMDQTRWAKLAAELHLSPDELTDYSRRITLFMVGELRWGGTFVLERWYGQSFTLDFDRFQPITGIDFPPPPKRPEPLLPATARADGDLRA